MKQQLEQLNQVEQLQNHKLRQSAEQRRAYTKDEFGRMRRWGCHFRCKKCGYKVIVGGKRTLLEISKCINDVKEDHKHDPKCSGARWYEKWSHHAVELDHTQVQMFTNRTTTSATMADITGARIPSSFFTAGRKYLILIVGKMGFTVSGDDGEMRVQHGSTTYPLSTLTQDPNNVTGKLDTFFLTVWTAIASQDIDCQHRREAGTGTVDSDQYVLHAIEISEDLTENTDWKFTEGSAGVIQNTTPKTVRSLNITPATAGHDWLYIGFMVTKNYNAGSSSVNMRNDYAGTVTDSNLAREEEGEGSEDKCFIASRVTNWAAVSQTVTITTFTATSSPGANLTTYSGLFFLNLNSFQDHGNAFTNGGIGLSGTDYATQMQTVNLTTSQTGDVMCIASGGYAAGVNVGYKARIQVDGGTEPSAWKNVVLTEVFDTRDHTPDMIAVVSNETGANHDWDYDGSEEAAGGTMVDRSLAVFSLELPGAPPAGVTRTHIPMVG